MNKNMKVNTLKKRPILLNTGYTLVELVTVIVLLGILSAYVTMRFGGMERSARGVAVKALAGRIRVVTDTIYNLSVAQGIEDEADSRVNLHNGGTVRVVYGYPAPSNDGIVLALQYDDGSHSLDSAVIEVEVHNATAGALAFPNPDRSVIPTFYDHVIFLRSDARKPRHCKVTYTYNHDLKQPRVDVDISNCE